MPDYLKWSTSNVDYADQYGNVWVANEKGSRAYGATSETGFYVGIDPADGGYTLGIYRNNTNYPYFYQAPSDTALVALYNQLFNTSHTTANQVIDAVEADDDLILYGQIERDDLLWYFDAANTDSYPGTGNTWNDLENNSGTDVTINGATYSNGIMQFDGSNDWINFSSNRSINVANGFTFWFVWDLPAQSSGAWNYFLYHDPSGNHKYEFGQYGTAANTFHYKDNISYAGTAMTTNIGSGYASYAFGTTSNGYSFTSVNGAAKTIKNPGSNSYWATTPTTNMVFSDLFRGAGSYLAANVKMFAAYNRELTDTELAYNHRFGAAHRL